MPRLVQAEIGNLSTAKMLFAVPDSVREAPTIYRLQDGSLILQAVPFIANQDLLYYAYEVPTEELLEQKLRWDVDHGDPSIKADEIAWNTPLIGRLTMDAAENMCDQFEGLPITDGHTHVEPGRREEVAVGTFLQDAVLDGMKVRCRALLYSAPVIVKVDANGSELSIGGDGFLAANDNRGKAGEPDFFIQRINLNHVALVEEGRAGPEARLLNHKASLANQPPKKKDSQMKTIIINGVAHEVPDAVADEFARMNTAAAELTQSNATLTNSVGTLTTERDTAQGALAVAQTALTEATEQVTALTNATPDVTEAAAAMAAAHATFVTEAARLGHTDAIAIGGEAAVMVSVLNSRGASFTAETDVATLRGVWEFALANASTAPRSVIDPTKPALAAITSVSAGATAAINHSYFGAPKPEKKEA